MSERHLTNTPLSSLDLPEALFEGISHAGFAYCTPIQATTLPLALTGIDVAGQAQTGTGKSTVFFSTRDGSDQAFRLLAEHGNLD